MAKLRHIAIATNDPKATAEFYFGCAEHDSWSPIEMVEALEQAARTYAPNTTEVEVYPGAHHGFAFPERAIYNTLAAEETWHKMFAMWDRTLK